VAAVAVRLRLDQRGAVAAARACNCLQRHLADLAGRKGRRAAWEPGRAGGTAGAWLAAGEHRKEQAHAVEDMLGGWV
jgi:hypothetical protein